MNIAGDFSRRRFRMIVRPMLCRCENYEIYDALLQLQAMILASSKEAGSPSKLRVIGDQFAKRLRRLVAEFKKTYDREGVPFKRSELTGRGRPLAASAAMPLW